MSITGSEQWMYSSGREFYDFPIEQSLRFNDNDSAYLSRTPASAGTQTTYTLSMWFKYGNIKDMMLFGAGSSTSNQTYIRLWGGANQSILWETDTSATTDWYVRTNALLRDPSAWYHLTFVFDNSLSGITNKAKIYINGELASIAASSGDYPSGYVNAAVPHYIGRSASTTYTDGYMAEVNFIDGQALDPTSFGELKSGIWIPKDTSGLTFGTNGFRLQFGDTTEANGFNAVTYTGNGSSQSISGVGFSSSPDFVWIKERSSTSSHILVNSVTGATKLLSSNTTDAEQDDANKVASLDADGFTLGPSGAVNQSSQTYVAWAWDAGSGSASDNENGSITSSVKANTDYGFSIVSYTGTGSATSWGHGLGVQPDMVIVKNRSGTNNWAVYHSEVPATQALLLSTTNAAFTTGYWNNTAPTSSIVNIAGDGIVNTSGNNYIAYCFAEKTGYSKFGSYTGNGSTSGPTITTGFRPAFVMIKRTDYAADWLIIDNTRSPINYVDDYLKANSNAAEQSNIGAGNSITWLSDGFQITGNWTSINDIGGTFIYMAFADTRDAAFWRDTSGEGNDWQPNNLVFSDVVPDSTSNNWCVLNPLSVDYLSQLTYAEGNLRAINSTVHKTFFASMGVSSGKWYWEAKAIGGNKFTIGLTDVNNQSYKQVAATNAIIGYTPSGLYAYGDAVGVYARTLRKNGSTVASNLWSSYADGDIMGIAFDADTGKVWFHQNGVWSNGAGADSSTLDPSNHDTTVATGETYIPAFSIETPSSWYTNFGQDSTFAGATAAGGNADENGLGDFAYAPPSGFLSLNSSNLPTGAIDTLNDETPEDYFNTLLWTGDGSNPRTLSGLDFAPDLIWHKSRSSASMSSHAIQDVVRGFDANNNLYTNLTGSETDYPNRGVINSVSSTGFTFNENASDYSTADGLNQSGVSFVAWNWKAGGTGVSNTDGSITSTVSVGATSQQNWFSVVSWTGTGANATVGHGLGGAVPDMIIAKRRNTTGSWGVYHSGMTSATYQMWLNLTNGEISRPAQWNSTTPTSSVFSIGTDTDVNASGSDYIAYCFANAEGLCKAGSYTGNGSSDGTFVYTGFRPKWIMLKCTNESGDNWTIFDATRSEYNGTGHWLYANASSAEGLLPHIDALSNGFKFRDNHPYINETGDTYIFLAIAEQPFSFANAR